MDKLYNKYARLVKEWANKLEIHSDLDPKSVPKPGFMGPRHSNNRPLPAVEPAGFLEQYLRCLLTKKRIFLYTHNMPVLCQVLPHYHSRKWESSAGAQAEVQENSCQGNLSRGSGYQVSDKWQFYASRI